MMWRWLPGLLAVLLFNGCVSPRPIKADATAQHFRFPNDTFAYANELNWDYVLDSATGRMKTHRRTPAPKYALHCFAMTRAARQFFDRAQFEPSSPRVDNELYARLIRNVLRPDKADREGIAIPGYADLREFSRDKEPLLKSASGGRWRSYFQRGNWRMVFPFPRSHQERQSRAMIESLRQGRLPIVHLVRFPQLTINHAMLVYDFKESRDGIEFVAYDPNDPFKPAQLEYRHSSRTFHLPANRYFAGGRVDVYEIYRGGFY
jgi:hypothetical protein